MYLDTEFVCDDTKHNLSCHKQSILSNIRFKIKPSQLVLISLLPTPEIKLADVFNFSVSGHFLYIYCFLLTFSDDLMCKRSPASKYMNETEKKTKNNYLQFSWHFEKKARCLLLQDKKKRCLLFLYCYNLDYGPPIWHKTKTLSAVKQLQIYILILTVLFWSNLYIPNFCFLLNFKKPIHILNRKKRK